MGATRHLLRARDSTPCCVVCRDVLRSEADARACPGCAALYHPDCLAALDGRCATLGCGRQGEAAPAVWRPTTRPVPACAECARSGPTPAERVGSRAAWLAPPALLLVAIPLMLRLAVAGWPRLSLGVAACVAVAFTLLWATRPEERPAGTRTWAELPAPPAPAPLAPRAPAPPAPAPPPPARPGAACLLCPRPAAPGAATCADHAALLADRLGPAAPPAGTRPGQLYGPGLIDGGERRWRA